MAKITVSLDELEEGKLEIRVPEPTPEQQEILENITLETFNATPSTIEPFAASLLSWIVTGPPGKFSVGFGSEIVPASGSKFVRPLSTTTYGLNVRVGPFLRSLGATTVIVNLDNCEPVQILGANLLLKGLLKLKVNQNPLLRFRRMITFPFEEIEPFVEFKENVIRVRLALKYSVDILPDPDVDIDAKFNFIVAEDKLLGFNAERIVPSFQKLDLSVNWPPETWVIPGAVIALPIATGHATDDGKENFQNGIQEFASAALQPAVPTGRRIHSVHIFPGSGTILPYIEVHHCPDQAPLATPVTEKKGKTSANQ